MSDFYLTRDLRRLSRAIEAQVAQGFIKDNYGALLSTTEETEALREIVQEARDFLEKFITKLPG